MRNLYVEQAFPGISVGRYRKSTLQNCNSHLRDERSSLAHGLAPHPRVLLPIDGEVVWQACNDKEPKDESQSEPWYAKYLRENTLNHLGLKGIHIALH